MKAAKYLAEAEQTEGLVWKFEFETAKTSIMNFAYQSTCGEISPTRFQPEQTCLISGAEVRQ